MKIFITGITGFVGNAVAQEALKYGMTVHGQARQNRHPQISTVLKEIMPSADWSDCLKSMDCVVHCAARVHQMDETIDSPLEQYRLVNTVGTLNLARQAADNGVKRFVFISSVKVNGESTQKGKPFVEQISELPTDPYGISKWEAEQQLRLLSEETGMEVVIIRPPLVYGPGVKANFLSMLNWVYKRVPLPLGQINNQRSMVFIDNLADLILTTVTHPKAANQTFLVSDDHDVSVTELLREISACMNVRSALIPIPQSMLCIGLSLVGKGNIAQKLTSSLQVDMTKTKECLNWSPKYSLHDGIKITVQDYLAVQERTK